MEASTTSKDLSFFYALVMSSWLWLQNHPGMIQPADGERERMKAQAGHLRGQA